MDTGKIRKLVRERYGSIARKESSCCGPGSACGEPNLAERVGRRIGYSEEEMEFVPQGANLGLGCGNPTALASLRRGETVLDLGSGAGFDCFLASREVGPEGRVIGVDMTPEMVEKARENARREGYANVEFRLGEIENLPVADNAADVILSNCVINLVPNKKRVFEEAYRALKPGGRLMVSDLVLSRPLPEWVTNNASAYVGCIAGAIRKEEYLKAIEAAGFREVEIVEESSFPAVCFVSDPLVKEMVGNLSFSPGAVEELEETIASIRVYGIKPAGKN